jgi:hypothetical protein
MPSDYESFGRVAMEAAASGIPTIAAPTPGLRECLGDAGTFVELDNVDGWERAIRALLDPDAYRAAALAARARFDAFTLESDAQLLHVEGLLAQVPAAYQRAPVTTNRYEARRNILLRGRLYRGPQHGRPGETIRETDLDAGQRERLLRNGGMRPLAQDPAPVAPIAPAAPVAPVTPEPVTPAAPAASAGMTRSALNALAAARGITAPERLPNKAAVLAALAAI